MEKKYTMNPIPSVDPCDGKMNMIGFDEFSNSDKRTYLDRFKRERLTISGILSDQDDRFAEALKGIGYERIGDYEAGLEVKEYNQIFRRENPEGQWEWYMPSPDLELPYTLTGDWETEGDSFVSVGDAALRDELAGEGGAGLIGFNEHRNLLDRLGDFISVKDFGAKGDGIADDTDAFKKAFLFGGDKSGAAIYIPPGKYRLTDTLVLHSWTEVFGSGTWQSELICDHNGAVIDYAVGDNFDRKGINQYQGGGNIISGFTIKRLSMPTSKIEGNFGINMPATWGTTIIKNIDFENMGDTDINYVDIAPVSVGSGPIIIKDIGSISLHSVILDMRVLFAQVFIDNVISVRNGGGIRLNASSSTSGFYAANVSIRNCCIETSGLGPGGALSEDPRSPLEAIRVNGLMLSNNHFSVHTNNKKSTAYMQNCRAVEISGSNFFLHGSNASNNSGILDIMECDGVYISPATLMEGLNLATFGIRVTNSTNVVIDNPLVRSMGESESRTLLLRGATAFYPIYVKTPTDSVLISDGYDGSIRGLANRFIGTDKTLVNKNMQLTGAVSFAVSDGSVSVLNKVGNIESVSRVGAGEYSVSFTQNISANYFISIGLNFAGRGSPMAATFTSKSSSGFVIRSYVSSTGVSGDINSLDIAIHSL